MTATAEWTVIHAYTVADAVRDQAMRLADGQLTAEAGYKLPVAFTRAAWAEVIAWHRGDDGWQSETGRLWDVLTVARRAAQAAVRQPGDRYGFIVYRVPNRTPRGRLATGDRATRAQLVVSCQAWDTDGRAALVVMRPGED